MKFIVNLIIALFAVHTVAMAQNSTRNWNKLMQEKGYKPIEEYYIK